MKWKGLLTLALCGAFWGASAHEIWISPNGNDQNQGTQESPLATIKKAQERIKALKNREHHIDIILQSGKYFLDHPLAFTPSNSGTQECTVDFIGKGDVELLGAQKITQWKKIGKNHWVATLPQVAQGKWYFRQLFQDEKRLTRARIPNKGYLTTEGPLTQYNKTVGKYTWGQEQKEKDPANYWGSRCGFQFRKGDLPKIKHFDDAEVLIHHSWESSWQAIRTIDTKNRDIHMYSPCRYPIGTFGKSMRYRIENIPEALDQAGEWYLNSKTGELHYLASEGDNPNNHTFYAPHIVRFASFQGNKDRYVENIHFKNISFNYCQYPMGIYDIAPHWPQEIQKGDSTFPSKIKQGYTDAQASPRAGEAFFFDHAQNISFYKCQVKHTGAYAFKVAKYCNHIKINTCNLYDLGGGGLVLGFPTRDLASTHTPLAASPHHNTLINSFVHFAGKVFPAAVGILIAQSHDNLIEHNDLYDISYCGVSLGWTWSNEDNDSFNNEINNNKIHNVAQVLGDCAGIYSLGNCVGSRYYQNDIDNIVKGKGVYGVVDAMGFDARSKNITIEENVVGRISGKVASFSRDTRSDLQIWKNNNFSMSIERPILPSSNKIESPEFTLRTQVKIASTFLDLSGWTEQRWILATSTSKESQGYYGVCVEGDKVVAQINPLGGKEGVVQISSQGKLHQDQINDVAISYNGKQFVLWINGENSASKEINQPFVAAQKGLKLAPIAANSLQDGIERMDYYPMAIAPNEYSEHNTSFSWQKAKTKEPNVDFNSIAQKAGPTEEAKTFFHIKR